MKEFFIEHEFYGKSRRLIKIVDGILERYEQMGYLLSVRQLYYQLVTINAIENNLSSYNTVVHLVKNGREAGLIDWDMIEDRSRQSVAMEHWDNPAGIITAAADAFRLDKWKDQPCYIEVMVEKEALEGVFEPVCRALDIRFSANKGYSSASALYQAGKRMEAARREGKECWLLYQGDFDASGLDMDRDVTERVEEYSRGPVQFRRLALTMDQVRQYGPPEQFAKQTDRRFVEYQARYKTASSWELDALDPRVMGQLIVVAVKWLRDEGKWTEAVAREEGMRRELREYAAECDAS